MNVKKKNKITEFFAYTKMKQKYFDFFVITIKENLTYIFVCVCVYYVECIYKL